MNFAQMSASDSVFLFNPGSNDLTHPEVNRPSPIIGDVSYPKVDRCERSS
jgi:hypothetical protein